MAAKGFAILYGRGYVLPDDIKRAALPVLSHRLILTNSEMLKKNAAERILNDILSRVPVPTEAVFDGSK